MTEKETTICSCGAVYYKDQMTIDPKRLYSGGTMRDCPSCAPCNWRTLFSRKTKIIPPIGHLALNKNKIKYKHEIGLDIIRDLLTREGSFSRQTVLPKLFFLLENLINHTLTLHPDTQTEVRRTLQELSNLKEHKRRFYYYLSEAADMITNNETWDDRPVEMNG